MLKGAGAGGIKVGVIELGYLFNPKFEFVLD